MADSDNGWVEYRKLVLSELERLNTSVEGLRDDLNNIRNDITALKIKAGFWGLVGATPVAVVIALLQVLN